MEVLNDYRYLDLSVELMISCYQKNWPKLSTNERDFWFQFGCDILWFQAGRMRFYTVSEPLSVKFTCLENMYVYDIQIDAAVKY